MTDQSTNVAATQLKPSVIVKFTAKTGEKQNLINHLLETSKNSVEHEQGTKLFVVSTSPLEENAVYIYELYANEEAKIKHESSDIYKSAKEQTGKLTIGAPQVIPLIPQGGKGIE